MRPGDDKAGKGPLQKYGEAERVAEQSLGTSCPPHPESPAPFLRGSEVFQLWGELPNFLHYKQVNRIFSLPSLFAHVQHSRMQLCTHDSASLSHTGTIIIGVCLCWGSNRGSQEGQLPLG